mgnify:CR=1 FL=1
MKKWIGPFISLLLLMGAIYLSDPFSFKAETSYYGGKGERAPSLRHAQVREKGEESDSYYVQVLKQFSEKLEGWLKALNERIESEDVTRLEVRFLEILRSILEWVKEKIDAKIKAEQEQKEKKPEKGLFRETKRENLRFCSKG